MKHTQREVNPPPGAPMWYVTFSDMMTLLLACFVLMLSFSTVSKSQFGTATRSLSGALGAWNGVPDALDSRPKETKEAQALHEAAREFRRQLQVAGRASDVELEYTGHVLKLVLPADRVLEEDLRGVSPGAVSVLQLVDALIARVPQARVKIAGHGDGTSLASTDRYAEEVKQSYGFAEMVYAALRGMPGGIDAHRPVLVGSGDADSLATAATAEGRRKNRRVEIVLETAPAAGGAAS